MRISFCVLVGLLVPVVMMADAAIVPVHAQTTIEPNVSPPVVKQPRVRRHFRTKPVASAAARNEGPTSTAGGNSGTDMSNANSGLARVPGAPSAGGSGSTGGH